MKEADAGNTKQPDPTENFRQLRDAYLEIWSKNLIDAVNTEGYAQASGAALDNYLNLAAPYKEAAEQAMLRTLQQLNMPSSVDFAGLAGRFTNIEMQLDNMDAKLDRIEKLAMHSQSGTPAEARKPAESATRMAHVPQSAKPTSAASEKPKVSQAAKKTASARKSAGRTVGISRRTKAKTSLRRTARKGTK